MGELYASELYRRVISGMTLNDMRHEEDGVEDNTYGIHQAASRPSPRKEGRVSPDSLSSLDTITIPQLRLSQRHNGRVLYGKFCIEPFMSQAVNDVVTLLVDANANSIRVIMSELLCTASKQETERRFATERKVAIREPLIEICADGMPAVRLINLTDVVVECNGTAGGHTAAELSDSRILRKIRDEGNRLFAKQDLAGAVKQYSKCIDQALKTLDKNGSASTNSQQELMLSYSNRAEARLRLQHYEDALTDAEEALKIEPKHLKTLVRKGKAAHALQLYEKACEAYKDALRQSPEDHLLIRKNLNASTTALKQSSTGEYDIDGYLLGFDETEDAPSCADFTGPVEIRRVGYGRRGLGLFATRNVKAGEILLVSNPVAVVRHNACGESLAHPCISRGVEFHLQRNLISKLAERVKTSKRQMAQVQSLNMNRTEEMVIPSMKLFKPGSDWVPDDRDELEMDIDLITDIARSNFTRMGETIERTDGVEVRMTAGIWILPSFANHSCAPSVINSSVGDANFFRASVDLLEGDELTICTLPKPTLLLEGVDARQLALGDACECARCRLEEALHPKLSKFMKVYLDIERAYIPFTEGLDFFTYTAPLLSQKQRILRDFAKVANAVEVVLQSDESGLGPDKQGWIRASFLTAYQAKAILARDKGEHKSAIAAMRLVLDAMTSVSVGPASLVAAKCLFKEMESRCPPRSQIYKETLDRVVLVFKTYYGNLGEETLLSMAMG